MLLTLAVVLVIGAVALTVMQMVKAKLLMPVRAGDNQSIEIIIRVSGSSPQLENTVEGLRWAISNGSLPAVVYIVDDGMDKETRLAAEILTKNREDIVLCESGEV